MTDDIAVGLGFRRQTWIALVVAHLVASAVHFTDNVLRFEHYPEPTWLNAPLVAGFWFLLAALALLGLRSVLRGEAVIVGLAALGLSAFLGIAGLGHYLIPGHHMDWFMQASIWFEAAAGLALLVGVLRESTALKSQ